MLTDRDEMSILYRGPSIDASYKDSVYLASIDASYEVSVYLALSGFIEEDF